MYEKSPKVKNKKHLIYVSTLKCCLAKVDYFGCSHVIQAHHLLKPEYGVRGMGMKASDNNAVPLCQHHHTLLHDKFGNEDEFWVKFGLSKDYGRKMAKDIWRRSPHKNT